MANTKVEITFRVGDVSQYVQKRVGLAVNKARLDIEALAKTVVPVDTGYLKNSIESRMTSPMQAEITVGAEYGVHVEYGTTKMPARPFLSPAIDRVRAPFIAAIEKILTTRTNERTKQR